MKDSNSPPIIDSPSMFACAMSPHTVYGSECCDKEGMKASKKEALNLNSIMDVFKAYGLSFMMKEPPG